VTKSGFTFIEVLVSILLIFVFGSAVINLDAFIKDDIQKNTTKHALILSSSALLHSRKLDNKTNYRLYDFITFDQLDDDNMNFLKEFELSVDNIEHDPVKLYEEGDFTFTIEYYEQVIKKGDTGYKVVKLGS
jgi:hypothetical protein